jgi:tetratricopeptide (TPR) repeat protein
VANAPDGLPAANWHFTGRAAELHALSTLLKARALDGKPPAPVPLIVGAAGSGKTALAVQWAHQVTSHFPDGQLYADLRGSYAVPARVTTDGASSALAPAVAGETIRGFLDALEVPAESIPPELDAQLGLYHSLLAGKRMLILLDDAADAAQVLPLLPAGGGCFVLVTSRQRMAGLADSHDAAPLSLDALSADDGRALAAKLIGARGAAADSDLLDQLIAACGGLPLTLTIACAWLGPSSDVKLRTGIAELTRARLVADEDGYTPAGLAAVISLACRQLDDPAARLFRLLSVHPGADLAASAAASLAGLDIDAASRALAELSSAYLLARDRHGRYRLAEQLAAQAHDQSAGHDSPAERQAATRRLLDHYLHTAHTADRLLFPHRPALAIGAAAAGVRPEPLASPDEALRWLVAEHRVLLAAIALADRQGFDAHAWQLTCCVAVFLDLRGYSLEFGAVQRIAITAAARLGDLDGLARSHHAYAHALIRLGDDDDAVTEFQRALDLYRSAGDRAGQGSVHLGLSQLLCRQGDYETAVPQARQALDRFAAADDHNGQAQALNQLGWSLAHLGAVEPAIEYCHQALGMYGPGLTRAGEPETWDSLGYSYHRLGDHRLASSCYEQAMTLWRAAGDRYNQALTLVRLGEVHDSAGDPAAAEAAWGEALVIFHELKHPQATEVQARLRAAPRRKPIA